MKACEYNLDLKEVLNKSSVSLSKKIEYSINLIRKFEKIALQLDPINGFYNTFSGGKDSQCLYHIVKLSGVKYSTYMNLTSVDPPEVLRFVKTQYSDVELIKPKMSIYEMAKKKHILPTITHRWCCHEFKETSGAGKDKILLSPILYWSEQDVWEFLKINNIPHCELYDKGYKRIGCICCPMSSNKQKINFNET